jgi:hypothetical protein
MENPLAKLSRREEEERRSSDTDGNGREYTGKRRRIDLERLMGDFRRSFLMGKEIMLYTEDGYHYGVLQGLDSDFIYLGNYVFDKQKMSVFEYSSRAGFRRGVVPREKMKAMSEIPLIVRKEK